MKVRLKSGMATTLGIVVVVVVARQPFVNRVFILKNHMPNGYNILHDSIVEYKHLRGCIINT
jgi:hypothetical protein